MKRKAKKRSACHMRNSESYESEVSIIQLVHIRYARSLETRIFLTIPNPPVLSAAAGHRPLGQPGSFRQHLFHPCHQHVLPEVLPAVAQRVPGHVGQPLRTRMGHLRDDPRQRLPVPHVAARPAPCLPDDAPGLPGGRRQDGHAAGHVGLQLRGNRHAEEGALREGYECRVAPGQIAGYLLRPFPPRQAEHLPDAAVFDLPQQPLPIPSIPYDHKLAWDSRLPEQGRGSGQDVQPLRVPDVAGEGDPEPPAVRHVGQGHPLRRPVEALCVLGPVGHLAPAGLPRAAALLEPTDKAGGGGEDPAAVPIDVVRHLVHRAEDVPIVDPPHCLQILRP